MSYDNDDPCTGPSSDTCGCGGRYKMKGRNICWQCAGVCSTCQTAKPSFGQWECDACLKSKHEGKTAFQLYAESRTPRDWRTLLLNNPCGHNAMSAGGDEYAVIENLLWQISQQGQLIAWFAQHAPPMRITAMPVEPTDAHLRNWWHSWHDAWDKRLGKEPADA